MEVEEEQCLPQYCYSYFTDKETALKKLQGLLKTMYLVSERARLPFQIICAQACVQWYHEQEQGRARSCSSYTMIET